MRDFKDLIDIIAKLRSPEGCPWDRKQTHESLLPFLLEESNEVFDAVLNGDKAHLREELGDLLLQIVLHSQIAKENGDFDINQVVDSIAEKLVRRHPHVFSDAEVESADEVTALWEDIKRKEKAASESKEVEESLLDSIPKNFEPLLKSHKMQKAAAKVGFDWDNHGDIIDKIYEELDEVKEAIEEGETEKIEAEIGDLFFSVVNLGRFLEVQSNVALSKANKKFYDRFGVVEELVRRSGRAFNDFTLEELDRFWEEAKKREANEKND